MYKYILKHKKLGVHLNYKKSSDFNHYVHNSEEATLFTYEEAKERQMRFKHPENWEIIKRRTRQ